MELIINSKKHGRFVVFFDEEDADLILSKKWHIRNKISSRNIYAAAYVRDGKITKNILMHRLIMNPSSQMVVDHKNHNGLDNRRSNLRVCTNRQNTLNHRNYRKNPRRLSNRNNRLLHTSTLILVENIPQKDLA